MLNRVILVLLAVFWLGMNFLLWRAEYGDSSALSSPVPPEVVWDKIRNSPDYSTLAILHRGKRIGQCSLQTSVSDEFSGMDEAPRQGVKTGNRVRLEGSISIPERRGRLRFESELLLDGKTEWDRFKLRVARRASSVEVESDAANRNVRVNVSDDGTDIQHTFTFAELKNPMALLDRFLDPVTSGMLSGLEPTLLSTELTVTDQPLIVWQARNDTLTIGHEAVRVYRLQTRLMDRFNVVIYVSRAGEILRAELPHGIILVHEKIGAS
ncbi:MAG TPA: hypothetical protein PKA41_00425 [Verrucomicrobiota bacterium]|nr:hypothetical protein [Verrucomicrobiota bacterium]